MQAEAEEIGFAGVLSGPLVRSSYRAGRLYQQAIERRTASSTESSATSSRDLFPADTSSSHSGASLEA